MTPEDLHRRLVARILEIDVDPWRPAGWADGAALVAARLLRDWGVGSEEEPIPVLFEMAAASAIDEVDPPHGGALPPDPPRLTGRNPIDRLAEDRDRRIVRCPACGDALGLVATGSEWLEMRGWAKRTARGYVIPTRPADVERAGAQKFAGYPARDTTTAAHLPAVVRCGGRRNDGSCRRWWRVLPNRNVEAVDDLTQRDAGTDTSDTTAR